MVFLFNFDTAIGANLESEVANSSPIMTKVKDYIRLKQYPDLEITTEQLTVPLLDKSGAVLVQSPWEATLVINKKTYRGVDGKKKNAITNAYSKAWEDLTGQVA